MDEEIQEYLTLELVSAPSVLEIYGDSAAEYYGKFEKTVPVESCQDILEKTKD